MNHDPETTEQTHSDPHRPTGHSIHADMREHDHEHMEDRSSPSEPMDHSAYMRQHDHVKDADRAGHDSHSGHDAHAGHGVMHEGHVTMMRNRFWVSLPLTLVVLLYSPMIQTWF